MSDTNPALCNGISKLKTRKGMKAVPVQWGFDLEKYINAICKQKRHALLNSVSKHKSEPLLE